MLQQRVRRERRLNLVVVVAERWPRATSNRRRPTGDRRLCDDAKHEDSADLNSVRTSKNVKVAYFPSRFKLWCSIKLRLFTMLRVVRPEDKDSVSLFAATLFSAHEPMTKALSIPAEDMAHLFSPIIEACCSSGLSFMLEQEGSIVCLSLALPYTQYKAVQWPEVPSALPVAAIMNSLPPLPAGQDPTNTVYMFLWGTGSTHMGKGYIRTAVEASMQATRRSGYSCLVADVTNVVSQHLAMNHFGFQPLEPRACYHDHESLKGVQGTEYVIRAVKYLAAEPAAEPAAATAYA